MKIGICLFSVVSVAALLAFLNVGYRQGFLTSKRIAAALFIFRRSENGESATVDSCSGSLRHTVRFPESRSYQFHFHGGLSKGDVEIVLSDAKKQPLLRLNRCAPTGVVKLDKNNKYFLRWEFRKATGRCELSWE